MKHDSDSERPERPRSEPEIILPGERFRSPRQRAYVYVDRGGERFTLRMPGPFAIVSGLVVAALLAGLVFALVLGVMLFALPIAFGAVAALLLAAYFRSAWGRLRRRFGWR